MGRAPFVSCNFFERRIAVAHIYQAAVHIMIFNKEERTYWIESYKNFPTSNISDAMDNLGLRSGVILGLHPLDVYQPRTRLREDTPPDAQKNRFRREISDKTGFHYRQPDGVR